MDLQLTNQSAVFVTTIIILSDAVDVMVHTICVIKMRIQVKFEVEYKQ